MGATESKPDSGDSEEGVVTVAVPEAQGSTPDPLLQQLRGLQHAFPILESSLGEGWRDLQKLYAGRGVTLDVDAVHQLIREYKAYCKAHAADASKAQARIVSLLAPIEKEAEAVLQMVSRAVSQANVTAANLRSVEQVASQVASLGQRMLQLQSSLDDLNHKAQDGSASEMAAGGGMAPYHLSAVERLDKGPDRVLTCLGTAFQPCSRRAVYRGSLVTRATSDPLLKRPERPVRPSPPKPSAPEEPQQAAPAAAAAAPTPAAATAAAQAPTGVTLEYQRQQAKALQTYFKSRKLQQTVEQAKVFGWTRKNEILNGRWVMFGIGVGLLTEYATGVSFVEQIKMTVSFLGIADVYD
ncbi:hypothetical protein N2152v2_006213 [Parachlorella kessleri]